MALPSKEISEQALDALITRERTRIVAPLTEWRNLSMALRQEGLARGVEGTRPTPEPTYTERSRRSRGWLRTTGRWTMRLATSAALVGVGVVAGRGMTIGQSFVNQIQAAVGDSVGAGRVRYSSEPFTTTAAARKTLLVAQTEYQNAAAYLAASDSTASVAGDPSIYQSRLAGLDAMTAASLNALKDAPQDPLLNQYFLSAVAAREATLQSLGNALPAGATMERF
jgi:hypothetical protein